jgi:putative alpha-1,2-mannosidase
MRSSFELQVEYRTELSKLHFSLSVGVWWDSKCMVVCPTLRRSQSSCIFSARFSALSDVNGGLIAHLNTPMARVLTLAALLSLALGDSTTIDPLIYVDPLIGASNGGNVFPGASLPYGMAKAVADTNSGSNQGGFTLDGANVTGFSVMHDSGTGGSPSLGNFPLFPYTSCAGGDVNACVFPKKARARFGAFANDSVTAKPGTFGITLNSGIRADMTTTHHTALFRFTFPSQGPDGQDAQPLILQDLSDLSDSRQDNATVSVDGPTGRITGSARFIPSFGSGNYVLHFCTDVAGAEVLDNGIFANSRASSEVKELKIARTINGYPLPGGAFVRFKSAVEPILVRTATSFISVDQACSHAEAEIPDFDFNSVSTAATRAWRKKLGPITVSITGVSQSLVTNFYSGIYRTMINPQDYTGENPLWSSTEPYFDSFYWCV